MLKFITLPKFVVDENRGKVFPFLFDYFYLKNTHSLANYSEVNNFEDADIAIFPLDTTYFLETKQESILYNFIEEAVANKKPVCVYSAGDFGSSLREDVYTFRMGGFHSKLSSKTFVMPSFLNDPVAEYFENDWRALPKSAKPNIGFVGHADGGKMKFLKEFLIYLRQESQRKLGNDVTDSQPFFPSSIKRFQLLEKLEKNKFITTNFIHRKKYRAGAINEEQRELSTLEFFKNINENLYTFCLRGSGNFSVRFYETLFMGRIPVLIDTDCRLPLANFIDWEKHCVLASADNLESVLMQFHNSKSEEQLSKIQESNRKLMLEKLNRIGFFDLAFNEIMKVEKKAF